MLPSRIVGGERNVIVEVSIERRLRGCPSASGRLLTALRIEQHQLATEPLKDNLSAVAICAALVGPFAGLKLPLEIDLGALVQVGLGDLGEVVVEDHNAVPFGALLAIAVLVLPAFGRGEAEIDHLTAVVEGLGLGIVAEIADENYLVDATHRAFS